jgi:hypothetical protein
VSGATPPPLRIEAYLPRIAFERITDADAQSAVERLRYRITPRWEATSNDLPPNVSATSVRVRCTIAEARVLLECFRVLVDLASASQDDEMLIAYAEAMGVLMDALDRVSESRD